MPFPAGRRIRMAFAVLALVLTGFAPVALPASAAGREDVPGQSAVTGPLDGAVVGGTAVVFSAPSADDGSGYELRWGTDPAVDAQSGRLESVEGGGDTIVTTTEYAIVDLGAYTYFWQVRALDNGTGMWSAPRSFTVDPDGAGLQLETYPFTEPSTGTAEAAGPLSAVSDGMWVVAASAFAVLFLAAVLLGARRARREA